jgi:hypothetical protein
VLIDRGTTNTKCFDIGREITLLGCQGLGQTSIVEGVLESTADSSCGLVRQHMRYDRYLAPHLDTPRDGGRAKGADTGRWLVPMKYIVSKVRNVNKEKQNLHFE